MMTMAMFENTMSWLAIHFCNAQSNFLFITFYMTTSAWAIFGEHVKPLDNDVVNNVYSNNKITKDSDGSKMS